MILMQKFDCVLIPGGGLLENGSLPPWTVARLEYALSLKNECCWFILLSGGTVHKPPPLNEDGFPYFESHERKRVKEHTGLALARVLTEISSYDTIGNAYFSRLLFTEPLSLKKLLVVTSEFHMPRTKAIFEWIFPLPPSHLEYHLVFKSTPDKGLSSQALAARVQREKNSLANLKNTIREITSLAEFLIWLYSEHTAYAPNKPFKLLSENELKSY